MPSPKITIKEVAQKADVSIASVSRFFNNPSILKEPSRRKIERAVKELNYQPLVFARRLAGGKLGVFSLIIPGYEGVFYSFFAIEVIRSLAAALDKKSCDLHLHVFWGKDNFKTSLVDGVIFADILGNDNQLARIIKEGLPAIVINKKVDDESVNYVAINNFKGAFDAVEFLINHGHKRIAHLAGDLRVQCAKERADGYRRALAKNNIEITEDYFNATNFSRKEAREKLEHLFSLPNPPTAIFCCSDDIAAEALTFAEERRIKIPKSLSIIGFDDNPNCLCGSLMLTTVRQPIAPMVSMAADILSELVEGKNTSPKRITMDTELVVRDTVSFL